MRVAEIINDYRTLLLHISQQNVNASQEEYWEEGFVVLRESLASAQTLMSANYQPCPVTGQGNVETEKAELQRYGYLTTRYPAPILTYAPGSFSTAAHAVIKRTKFICEPQRPGDGPWPAPAFYKANGQRPNTPQLSKALPPRFIKTWLASRTLTLSLTSEPRICGQVTGLTTTRLWKPSAAGLGRSNDETKRERKLRGVVLHMYQR